jgi:hypothetical protein
MVRKTLLLSAVASSVVGCTSVTVKPVSSSEHSIEHVCIQRNDRVIVVGFVKALENGLTRHGITSEVYSTDRPPEHCVYTLEYVAHQHWDLATYLWQAEVELRKGAEVVGSAEYHLREQGGLSLTKWSSVETKMAPVMDQLLTNFHKT